MIKAIIFDCFGVIYPDSLGYILKDCKLSNQELAEIKQLRLLADEGKISNDKFWDKIRILLKTDETKIDYQIKKVNNIDWEVLSFIKFLKQKYKTAMISNVSNGYIEQIFKNIELNNYFDEIVISANLGILKPDSRIYRYAADKLGVAPSECIYTDDKFALVEGAQRTGMKGFTYISIEDAKKQIEKIIKAQAG